MFDLFRTINIFNWPSNHNLNQMLTRHLNFFFSNATVQLPLLRNTEWCSCATGRVCGTRRTGSPGGRMWDCLRGVTSSVNLGIQEAIKAGKSLQQNGFEFDVCYTSVLTRAIQTFNYAADELHCHYIPVHKDWRLNERHYGALQGLNKL